MYTKEGKSTQVFSRNELRDAKYAQQHMREKGIVEEDSNALEIALGSFAAILGFFVTRYPTPVGVSLSVVSLAMSLTPNSKAILESLSIDGEDFLYDTYYFMDTHREYDLIEIEYPYLTYYDVDENGEDVKWVTGQGIIKRVHTSAGWVIL